MGQIKIMTPDPVVEKLLSLLAEQLPEQKENILLLDAVWMDRIREFSAQKVILFTTSADPGYLTTAKEAGSAAFWYLHPSAEALDRVLAGEPAYPEAAPAVQLGKMQSAELTIRELDVLRQLVGGRTDADIAAALRCSLSTVKHYLATLREKTGITSRVELAVQARSAGLIDFL